MGFLSWASGSSGAPQPAQPPQVFDRPYYGFSQNSPAFERNFGVQHKRYIPGAGWVTMGAPGEGKPPTSRLPPGTAVTLAYDPQRDS